MKVLILNTSEIVGGAAIAAKRLYIALNKNECDTKMLVLDKQTTDKNIIALNKNKSKTLLNKTRFLWERLLIYLNNKCTRKNLFKVSIGNTGTNISKNPFVKEADIIHIHWINQGFLSLQDIQKLIKLNKPIIWTLHDLWPATGICHYPDTCLKYQTICYKCPQLVKHPFFDLANITYKRKQKINFSPVNFVGCSHWITQQAQTSGLLKKSKFHTIPNPIDTQIFAPDDKAESRKKLNLPPHKQLLLFAAANIQDERKGLGYLIEACKIIAREYKLASQPEIILIGKGSEELTDVLPFKIHSLGYLSDASQIKMAYCSADLFVIPSLEDNLPNTIMESLACGTPCCGFNIGGIPEMIDHLKNGYIAIPKDAHDLAKGIKWILSHPEKEQLKKSARKKVEDNYNEALIAGKYINLYKSLLNEE